MVAGPPPDRNPSAWRSSTVATVGALGIGQIFGWGSSYYLLGALAPSIADETGWSETWILAGLSLSLLIAGALSPRVGRAVAKRGGRRLLAGSTLLLAGGLVILANSHGQASYVVGWTVMGLGMALGLYDTAFATLGSHLGEAARGPITALTLVAGFSSTATWPLSVFLLGQIGWRGACIAYAVIEVALCLPLYLLFAPDVAGRARAAPGAASPSDDRSPLRNGALYLLGAILTLTAALTATVSVNLIVILSSLGVAHGRAVVLATLLGPSQVLARLGEMLSGRNYHPTVTLVLATGSLVAGTILLAFGASAALPAVILYGAGAGLVWVARSTVPMAIFGPDGYAVRLGLLARPALIAQALAPAVGAFLLQTIGAVPTVAILAVASSSAFIMAIALVRASSAGTFRA